MITTQIIEGNKNGQYKYEEMFNEINTKTNLRYHFRLAKSLKYSKPKYQRGCGAT